LGQRFASKPRDQKQQRQSDSSDAVRPERTEDLIQPEAPLGFDNRGYRGTVDRHKCLVAQVLGLADTKTSRSEFSPVFVERVRKMKYPQLFSLPKRPGILDI
jgi:hypothetical protein